MSILWPKALMHSIILVQRKKQLLYKDVVAVAVATWQYIRSRLTEQNDLRGWVLVRDFIGLGSLKVTGSYVSVAILNSVQETLEASGIVIKVN